MKKLLKGYILGILTMALLIPSMAVIANNTRDISATFRNIRIFVDGEEFVPRDAHGNHVEPFLVDGSVFMSLRAASEIAGLVPSWDGENAFVHLNSEHGHVEIDPGLQIDTWLNHMPIADQYPAASVRGAGMNTWTAGVRSWGPNAQDNQGNTYDQGGIISGDDITGIARAVGDGHTISYNLNGEFSRFTGTIAVHHRSRNNARNHQIRFIADGEVVYTSPVITGNTAPIPFNVDMTGVAVLTIERVALTTAQAANAEIGIVNAGFTR